MSGNWKTVKQRGSGWLDIRPRAYVSVNRRGEIVMNEEAFGRIRAPANVTLLYDAKLKRIGVKFPVTADDDYFPVRSYGRGRRMRIVRGGRLLKQFGLELTGTLAFVNPEIENFRGAEMIVLPLSEGRAVRRRPSTDEHR